VHPVPDPLLFFSGSARNRTRASGSVAKNSDHQTTEAVSWYTYKPINKKWGKRAFVIENRKLKPFCLMLEKSVAGIQYASSEMYAQPKV
jgi:hypothetical protein